MKRSKLIAASVSGILSAGLLSGAAHATDPSLVAPTDRLHISGATATDNTLSALFLRSTGGSEFCKTTGGDTIDAYSNSADLQSATNRAIVCKTNIAIPSEDGSYTIPAGTPVAILKESLGGSDRGTVYVSDATSMPFRDLSNLAGCSAGTVIPAGTVPSFPNHKTFTLHTGCTATANVRTQGGIADVDPPLFNVGTLPINDQQKARLTSDPLYQPVFAVAVSLNTYRALQRMQGLALDDTLANVPSLKSDQVRGLFADGLYTDWHAIKNAAGDKDILDTTYTNGVTVPATLYVCRRGDESGTQASFAQYFLNERCALNSGVNLFKNVSNPANQQNGAAFTVPTFTLNGPGDADDTLATAGSTTDPVWGSTSGGVVRTCLDSHNDVNHFAIGILGSDSVYNAPNSLGGMATHTAGNGQWRYIGLDGAAPTLVNVANGKYNFVMENVLNRRNAVFAGQAVITQSPLAIMDYIKTSFASLDIIGALIVTGNTHGLTGGLAGGYSGTPNAVPVTQAQLLLNPVSPFTKSPLGPVNNCGPTLPVIPLN